jgi:hypothetical protein
MGLAPICNRRNTCVSGRRICMLDLLIVVVTLVVFVVFIGYVFACEHL